MRLGGPVFGRFEPELWAREVRRLGYRAAVCPVGNEASEADIQSFSKAAQAHDIMIAEVGAWSNPISIDDAVRADAIRYCQKQLALADAIGARVCVNIAGSRGPQWDGPHPDNLSEDTFDLIVDTVREIIDAVRPTRTHYALESMPWVFPDSPDAYLRLIHAIDRPQFAVHFDPVNLISSPRRFYQNAAFLRECFQKLGPYLKSCHAKDIRLGGTLTVHLEETIPGTGSLDYRVLLTELSKMPVDTPILVEHLITEEEYRQAADHIRNTASELGISLN